MQQNVSFHCKESKKGMCKDSGGLEIFLLFLRIKALQDLMKSPALLRFCGLNLRPQGDWIAALLATAGQLYWHSAEIVPLSLRCCIRKVAQRPQWLLVVRTWCHKKKTVIFLTVLCFRIVFLCKTELDPYNIAGSYSRQCFHLQTLASLTCQPRAAQNKNIYLLIFLIPQRNRDFSVIVWDCCLQ